MKGLSIGLLTSERLPELAEDEEPLVRALIESGHEVLPIIWSGQNWAECDCLVFRNTWDYIHHFDEFLKFLDQVETSGLLTMNELGLIRSNLDKKYLKDLKSYGLPVVPTQYFNGQELANLLPEEWVQQHRGEFVLKPTISADSTHTFRGSLDELLCTAHSITLAKSFQWMLQPFLQSIIDEGEFSLIFFNGEPSHCVLKKVKSGDFRVQDTYGGTALEHSVANHLWTLGRQFLNALPRIPIYARVDLVFWNEKPHLLELELVEPSLFLKTNPHAGNLFASAINRRIQQFFS